MLAKVPLDLLEEVPPAPPSFTVRFNSDPGLITNQFSFFDAEEPVGNLVFVNTDNSNISITLAGEGAAFSQQPIIWSVPPSSGDFGLTIDGNKMISITVPKPTHALRPWIFRISLDTPEVKGILSQSIFLTKPASPQSEDLFLHYDLENSTFNLSDSAIAPDQDQEGIPLKGQESVLINAMNTQRTFRVNLRHQDLPPSLHSVSFAEPPVAWSTRTEPNWVRASRESPNQMQLQIDSPAGESSAGQCIGIRFVLKLTTAEGTTVKVLSPDPILVNTTIGDG